VHAELGDDKYIFANEVAEWILKRSGPEFAQDEGREQVKARL